MDDDEQPEEPTHPRFRARRAEVEDESVRSRNRKLVAVGLVVLAILLAAASTQSPLFDVDEVRIVGAERSSPDELRAVAGVELGTPILGLDTAEIEERLAGLPEVAAATASASWTGVVTVEIDERIPVARIESLEGTIIVAGDGVVLDLIEPVITETTSPEEPDEPGDGDTEAEPTAGPAEEPAPLPDAVLALPEISGAMFSTEPGKRVPTVLGDALAVATQLPADVVVVTERIEITVDSLVLRVVGGGAISIGDARDLDDKFDAIRAFLAQVDLRCLNTLNVRAPSVPVIVRNDNC